MLDNYLSKIFFALLLTIVSIVLHMADVREIGLQDCESLGSLFGFSRGIMVASFFYWLGNFPSPHDLFINLSNLIFSFLAVA